MLKSCSFPQHLDSKGSLTMCSSSTETPSHPQGNQETCKLQSFWYRANDSDIWIHRLAQRCHKPEDTYKFKETRLTWLWQAPVCTTSLWACFSSLSCSKEKGLRLNRIQKLWDKETLVGGSNKLHLSMVLAFYLDISVMLGFTVSEENSALFTSSHLSDRYGYYFYEILHEKLTTTHSKYAALLEYGEGQPWLLK